MEQLLKKIVKCDVCSPYLKLGTRPVLSASSESKILIIGQAPGIMVHNSGIPWDDKSGDRLREWMQVNKKKFYNEKLIGIVPMGFCYPGKGKTGDLPPRKECAPLWHSALMDEMRKIELIVLIGTYAQDYYLAEKTKKTLTKTVMNFEEYLPKYFVLPHPSPRNNIWMAKNKWFEKDVLPAFRKRVSYILDQD